jgi:signal transduction histidine kinase
VRDWIYPIRILPMPLIKAVRFLLLVLVLHLAWSALACAEQISQRAYWVDSSGIATYEQAKEQSFLPYSGVVSQGYTEAATWLRLRIEPLPFDSADQRIVLHIRPVFLDEIDVFEPISEHPDEPKVTGQAYPLGSSALPALSHNLLLTDSTHARDIYVRVHSQSASLIDVQAQSVKEFETQERRLELLYSLDLAVQLLLWVWVLLSWITERDGISRLFLLKQSLLIAHGAAIFGYHRLYLEPWLGAGVLRTMFYYGTVIAISVSIYFEYAFIRVYRLPYVLQRLLQGLVVACALNVGWMALGHGQSALRLGNLAILCAPLLLLVTSLCMKPADSGPGVRFQLRTTWVAGYALVLTVLLVDIALANAGVIVFSEISMNGSVVYSLVSGALMTLLLQYRNQKIRQQNHELSRALEIEASQAVIERAHQKEQKQFLYMLMHELKNPLAVINMTHSMATRGTSPRATPTSRAISDIKSIIDRCMEFDQLNEESVQLRVDRVDLALVIEEICSKYSESLVDWEVHVEPPQVLVTDRHYLSVILNNLADNALRYAAPLTALQIQVTPQANAAGVAGVQVLVSNQPGLASWPDPQKVFQKYYRSNGAMKQSGTGLGLFLVANLAHRLGGSCRYLPDSTHVRFSLWLPL